LNLIFFYYYFNPLSILVKFFFHRNPKLLANCTNRKSKKNNQQFKK